ncbi:3-methyl-2-oxobutanoate hydroxymethyltransferase [Marinobacterium arenosum]|uniref:3-methyl-2-oxobutanoate hydroxymethyltransferase n=1 Tax=Marinobacterium arenosum TaxID=2862496 RepID=UPI001C964BB9|nr:3-methyl-2-oxobutanoate hydroxymethyltransferase [Marinobacterium arenosum]MBY4676285.1 3-methyl-2-oxobutanoate hydroxymethyltransferase [Marinobacterium arenosum]
MSVHLSRDRVTVPKVLARKGGEKLVVLTAYSMPMARQLDPHCDILLVGDSLGMVLYGLPNTLTVSLDMMINHGAAVARGAEHALVVVDMPFGSYQESPQQAFRNAAQLMAQSNAQAVKLEGGEEMAETIAFLTARGIPVMAHVGLKPQSANSMGGFKVQGREDAEAEQIMRDAKAVEAAGAFSVVIEGTAEPVAARISANLSIPTIGIGASGACDGQVLVTDDLVGMFGEFTPKFVKRYADLGSQLGEAARRYAEEVRSGAFPAAEHCFGVQAKAKISGDR